MPLVVLVHYFLDLCRDVLDVSLGLLNGGYPVPLALPPSDVGLHLGDTAVLFLYLVAELALPRLVGRVVDQLQAARLSRPVLLVALLPEVPPLPVAAIPASLFEVAHRGGGPVFVCFGGVLDAQGLVGCLSPRDSRN